MATPRTMDDGVTDLDAAIFNQYVRGGKEGIKINYFGLLFTASTNVPTVLGTGTADNDGEVVTGDLSWNAGATRVQVVLTGFVNIAVITANLRDNAATNVFEIEAEVSTNVLAFIRFHGSGAGPNVVDPDANVQAMVAIIGF